MKILMLSESFYPSDIRIRQEALFLTAHGHEVSVMALKEKSQPFCEVIDGVHVYRIPKIELFKYGKQARVENPAYWQKMLTLGKAALGYGFEYAYFTSACMVFSIAVYRLARFEVIHTHNPPDSLFMVAFLYKLFGKRFVFDHHDLTPDLFVEKYGRRGGVIYRLLLLMEKISCQMADFVIATNASYKKIEARRCGVPTGKIYIVRNGPNLNEIKIALPIDGLKKKGQKILCYLGAINNQDGVDYLIRIMQRLIFVYGQHQYRLLIVGDGDYLPEIVRQTRQMALEPFVIFTGFVSERKMLNRYLSSADMFMDAAPLSFLNDSSTFIKHMEYMVFGKPILSFSLKESMVTLGDAGVFVPPNDIDLYAKKIMEISADPELQKRLGVRAQQRVSGLRWEHVARPLSKLYERINSHRHGN